MTMTTLSRPLPAGMRVINRAGTGKDSLLVVQVSLPIAVWSLLAETMDLAGRMTGSDKAGAQLAMICAEALSTWLPLSGDADAARARQEDEG